MRRIEEVLILLMFFVVFSCSQDGIIKEENGVPSDFKKRINGRDFPSIFQAWNKAENLPDEDAVITISRHDLYFSTPPAFLLAWNNEYQGMADGFTVSSINSAKQYREELLKQNPTLITIAELRYRDAPANFLPEESPWWMRNDDGSYVYGWEEGGFIRLEFRDESYQNQVAKKAAALIENDLVDGIMLDWWTEGEFLDERLSLLTKVREAIGEDALILLNANSRLIPNSAPYANGIFMECWDSPEGDADKWDEYRRTLEWAEENMRAPRINCLETWYKDSRNDLNRMRATTTLALTRSDGYCLFSDPNTLTSPDHLHNWYPFWDVALGTPVSKGVQLADGTWQRDFTGGTAVYNPQGYDEVEIVFEENRTSATTGVKAKSHTLPAFDGDIYLK